MKADFCSLKLELKACIKSLVFVTDTSDSSSLFLSTFRQKKENVHRVYVNATYKRVPKKSAAMKLKHSRRSSIKVGSSQMKTSKNRALACFHGNGHLNTK